MKNEILLFSLIFFLFSFNNWAQTKPDTSNEKKNDGIVPIPTNDTAALNKKMRIKHYHVEENVPIKFGGRKTTYDVSHPNLIQTYDLGPNNTRIVTPVFIEMPPEQALTLKSDSLTKLKNAKISVSDKPKQASGVAYIDIIKTYERVADKGYESIDMLKKMGNSYFFSDEFEKAEKCYSKLFEKTSDVEPEYYYRYAITLKAAGQVDKAKEYLDKFYQFSAKDAQR